MTSDVARVLTATFAYNEGEKIRQTLARHPRTRAYDLLVLRAKIDERHLRRGGHVFSPRPR